MVRTVFFLFYFLGFWEGFKLESVVSDLVTIQNYVAPAAYVAEEVKIGKCTAPTRFLANGPRIPGMGLFFERLTLRQTLESFLWWT